MTYQMDKRHNRKKDIPLRDCEICGVIIPRNTKSGEKRISTIQYVKARVCSKRCMGKLRAKESIGKDNSNYRGGKSKCSDCGIELGYRYSYRNNSKCRKCYNKWHKNENHWNWQNGKTGKNLLERNRIESKNWRLEVFGKDDFTCQICGYDKGEILNAHHIKSWAKFPELRYDINNGITLCKGCHINIHRK